MALDHVGLAGLAARRLDHIGIDRALGQPLHLAASGDQFLRLLVKDFHEQAADDLALGFRVGHTFQCVEVALRRIDADHLDAHATALRLGREHRHHLIALLPAQQAGIDEHAGEPIPDRPMQQGSHHRRIDATGQAQQDMVIADLFAHAGDLVLDDVGRGPQRGAAADLGDKALQQRPTLLRVGDFGMELHAVPPLLGVLHHRHRDALGAAGDHKPGRCAGDVVTMAHPYVELVAAGMIGEAVEQAARRDDIDLGMTELAGIGSLGGTAQLRGESLHAVTNAQDRQAGVEYLLRCLRCAFQGSRFRTARKNDALGAERSDFSGIVIPCPDLAVHANLANAARDQLGVLRTEVEYQDLVGVNIGHGFSERETGNGERGT